MKQTKKVINLYENKNQIVNAAIDRIVVEVFNKRDDVSVGQTILLTGCSPLVGNTTACISLAIAMANTKRKTLLVDCDVRKAIKYKKLNRETSVGLADYLLEDSVKMQNIDEFVYETNVEDLYYIPCGEYCENATRILCSSKMLELIDLLKNDYDCIIFDLPSINIVPDAQVLFGKVDGIVLVTALGETRKSQIRDAKRKVAPFVENYYGMIINKVEKDEYRRNLKDYDYYFINKKGQQKLTGVVHKKYKALSKEEGK